MKIRIPLHLPLPEVGPVNKYSYSDTNQRRRVNHAHAMIEANPQAFRPDFLERVMVSSGFMEPGVELVSRKKADPNHRPQAESGRLTRNARRGYLAV
jgi:hypothetical protein